jgi:hypothetical protein
MRGKRLRVVALLLMVASTFYTANSVYGQETSRSITITREAKLAGTTVSEGKYTITFDETKEGELKILKNGKAIATASYKLVELGKSAPENAVVYRAADGGFAVSRIELKGMKMAIKVD